MYTWEFIPGISFGKEESHSFIQANNGMTGQTWYFKYRPDQFFYSRKPLIQLFQETGLLVRSLNYISKIVDVIFLEKFHSGIQCISQLYSKARYYRTVSLCAIYEMLPWGYKLGSWIRRVTNY